MKLRMLCFSLAALAAGAALYAFQDQMQPPKPSAEHKVLQRSIGTWDSTVESMGQTSKGTMMVEAGPGGFTSITHFKGDMGGAPFEGRGIDGYDATKKKYVSIWTDSWTAAPLFMEGTWDEKTQTMSLSGEMLDMAGKMTKSRFVTKWTDNDHMDFEIFSPGEGGKEASVMKIKYARKK